jgi:steroid 5-alpha reductase family enzyme
MTVLWRLSVRYRDVSLIDLYWGPGFAVIAWIALALEPTPGPVDIALAVLVSLWGVRLGGYLWSRNRGKPEDARYAAMRSAYANDEAFERASLVRIFYLQGALMWLISLPVQIAIIVGIEKAGVLAFLGLGLFCLGFFFEAVGDYQLARFKRDPSNHGQVMDKGLWRYTRHPNYFGDACVWWGLYLIAAEAPPARWAILSPALMSFLLVRVTGKKLLEDGLRRTKPAYEEYVRRTSPFFPWPPRS